MRLTRIHSGILVLVATVAALVLAMTGTASAAPASQGCNQTPYGNPGNGANHGGVYDDTCDGTASGNGNGGGKAVGKPCAGCVGKADEKNPHGQDPNATADGNNGYECDNNNGIGKTNPAHTGCVSNQTPPPPPPGGTTVEGTQFHRGTKVLGVLAKTGAPLPLSVAAFLFVLCGTLIKRAERVLAR